MSSEPKYGRRKMFWPDSQRQKEISHANGKKVGRKVIANKVTYFSMLSASEKLNIKFWKIYKSAHSDGEYLADGISFKFK